VSSVAPVRARFEGIANDPAQDRKLQQAARQFESLFLQRIVSAMRKETSTMSPSNSGPGGHLYDHMINTALADHMTEGRGVGIADSLYRDWTGKSLQDTGDYKLTQAVDPPSVPAALLDFRSMNVRPSTPATPENDPKTVVQGAETQELNKNNKKVNDGAATVTPGIDKGSRPLGEMLPPDGTEKIDFFLNDSLKSHDGNIGRKLSARGLNNDYEKYPTNNDDRPASAVSRDRPTRKADGNRGGRQADLSRSHVESTPSSRHERHPVLGGDQQT